MNLETVLILWGLLSVGLFLILLHFARKDSDISLNGLIVFFGISIVPPLGLFILCLIIAEIYGGKIILKKKIKK